MLVPYEQFLVRQAIRSPMHLTNPRVVPSSDIALPRQSVIHHLNYQDSTPFPTRALNYLNNVPPSKRVPIQYITVLHHLQDATVVENRTLDRQLRAWQKDHTKDFRVQDLLVVPNSDTQTHALINYQNLKGLYRYKTSALAEQSRYTNVHQTYWENVHQAVAVDPNAHHFVHIPLPSLIPSKGLLDNLLKMPLSTYARVVHNAELNSVIQLYLYLNPATRDKSTMKALTEADTTQVNVELTYQGHSCFFNLSYLVALAKDSTLESKRKISADQLGRLYLLMVLKIHKQVFELQSGESASVEQPETDALLDEDSELGEGMDSDDRHPAVNQATPVGAPTLNQALRAPKSAQAEVEDIEKGLSGFTAELGVEVSELEGDSDDLFSKLMNQPDTSSVVKATAGDNDAPDNTAEPAEEDAVGLQIDYTPEHQTKLLTSPTLDDNLQAYITTAKASGSVSPAEIRSLKKAFEERKLMKSPYGDGLIDQVKVVTAEDTAFTLEDTQLDIKNDLVDDALKTEVLFNFDRLYLNKVLKKDVLACVTHLEQAGIVIKDYQVEVNHSALGSYEMHKLTLKPYKGKESTVYFRLPVINDEGEFRASNIDYRMRRQRQD